MDLHAIYMSQVEKNELHVFYEIQRLLSLQIFKETIVTSLLMKVEFPTKYLLDRFMPQQRSKWFSKPACNIEIVQGKAKLKNMPQLVKGYTYES
jgi:hypothetical protein